MFSIDFLNVLRKAEIDKIVPLLPAGARILEIGAGTGQQALELSRRGFDVTAIEIATSNYAVERMYPIVDYDGCRIPFPEREFDVVFSSNVLEHVRELSTIHAEIKRVLRPGGICIHILPTHAWRFWTTLASYPDALVVLTASLPGLVPRSIGRPEVKRLALHGYRTLRRIAGCCLPRRHGERGNVISELWLFHPGWWRRNFGDNGFAVVRDEPMGLFYTGHMLMGAKWPLERRAKFARIAGSACHVFTLRAA